MKLKIILDNLQFQNIITCSDKEINQILCIRNEDNVRKNMFNKHIILSKEHLKWLEKIKFSDPDRFYCVKYKNEIVGGLGLKNYDRELSIGEWAYYVSEKCKFVGLGPSIEFKALEYFFNYYKIKDLFCYVLKHNVEIIKLHAKFGFTEISCDKNFKNKALNIKESDVIHLSLNRSRWQDINKKIHNKYFE